MLRKKPCQSPALARFFFAPEKQNLCEVKTVTLFYSKKRQNCGLKGFYGKLNKNLNMRV